MGKEDEVAEVAVTRIVMDVMKPRELPITDLASALCLTDGVREVHIIVSEVDVKTETMKITVTGNDVNYQKLYETLETYGCALRSTDEIVTVKQL